MNKLLKETTYKGDSKLISKNISHKQLFEPNYAKPLQKNTVRRSYQFETAKRKVEDKGEESKMINTQVE